MKKILFILILIMSHHVFANECQFTWDAKIMGIPAGKLKDNIQINKDGVKIESFFYPSEALKIFGTADIKRNIVFDSNLVFQLRTEEHIGKNKNFTLKNIENTIVEIKDGIQLKNYEFKEKYTLDGTAVPYIFMFIPKNILKDELKLNILNKNNVIYSKILISNNQITFKENQWAINIDLDEQKNPKKIFIDDGKYTLTANILEKKCVP